jgi:putative spermidine/putrescine transport system substrate-binding protein
MTGMLTRRTMIAASISVLSAPSLMAGARAQTKKVVISGWGGSNQDALRKAFFEPFTRETGIAVEELTWGGQGLARLKAQADAKRVEVDLLDGPPFWATLGKRNGLLQALAVPNIKDAQQHVPGAINEMGYGYGTVSWGLAYLPGSYKANQPQSWSDFWDAAKFKGRRAFFGPLVVRHIEYALLADGVAVDKVNPLDDAKIDRAFAKLEQIKSAIDVWWQSSSQMESLFQSGEIDVGESLSGRAHYLQSQDVKLEFLYNQAVMNLLTWVMASGAPNKENANLFIEFCSRPDRQAALAQAYFTGPTNQRAFEYIKDDQLSRKLSTYPDNLKKQVQLDGAWWALNLDRLAPRWNKLVAG